MFNIFFAITCPSFLTATSLPAAHAEIGDLPVPLLDVPSAALLHTTNGVEISTGASSNSYSAMASSAGEYFTCVFSIADCIDSSFVHQSFSHRQFC